MLNWYQKYKLSQVNKSLSKEAGAKENIMSSLLAALVFLLSGSGVSEAAKKANIKEKDVIEATHDKDLMDKANNIIKNKNVYWLTEQKENASGQTQDQNYIKNRDIIARTIYAEAKSESHQGKMAVASVIYNRAKGNINNFTSVILKPYAFSCWNAVTVKGQKPSTHQHSDSDWEEATEIAESMLNGTFKPIVKHTHYYNPEKANPSWAYIDKRRTKLRNYEEIGSHRFLTLKI